MISFNEMIDTYDPSKNTTPNKLSKYERVKLIGVRAEQLQRGAIPLVPFDEQNFNARLIAIDELNNKKIPLMIVRTLHNGNKEYWRLDDMIL